MRTLEEMLCDVRRTKRVLALREARLLRLCEAAAAARRCVELGGGEQSDYVRERMRAVERERREVDRLTRERAELVKKARRALCGLGEPAQTVLMLRYDEGLTWREVARRCAVSESYCYAVRRRMAGR